MPTMESLQKTLFPGDEEYTYAVIDGASCDELLDKLRELRSEYACLYAGEIEPDIEEAAPYLVALPPRHAFTDWFLDEGFGKHWGIFARSRADLRAMRKHFRKFLLVKDPEGKTLYFRFYDPRVLQTYLPTCEPGELTEFFGPVSAYIAEKARPPAVVRFTIDQGGAKSETLG